MRIAIPTEIAQGETRVAAVPETVRRFVVGGAEVGVQSGAGERALFADPAYAAAGASVVSDPRELLGQSDLVLKVRPPEQNPDLSVHEVDLMREGAILICILRPAGSVDLVRRLAAANVTAFALDALPRIARAQSMDVLSSMSSIAGYKAVLMAADAMGKMIPMMMTAAGTIRPANFLIIGAGVAGLQAIATARRLGASVKAIDVRPAVKEQVESLGAKFVPMEVEHETTESAGGYAADLGEEFYRNEQEIIAPHLTNCDAVITTALIPDRRAPILITGEMVAAMASGAVIVDLAAEAGGNCSLTRPGEAVEQDGVTILAPLNVPALMPVHSSLMFARNAAAFVNELIADGQVNIDMDNPILRETLITRDGQVVHAATLEALEGGKEPQ